MTVPFVALSGAPRRAEEIKKLVPPWMETRYPSLIGAVLHALGVEDHKIVVGERTLTIKGLENDPRGKMLYKGTQDNERLRVKHERPPSFPSSLSYVLSGFDLKVIPETDVNGVILTTAAQVKTLLDADTAVTDLFGIVIYGDGSGLISLTSDYAPLYPDGLEGARNDIILSKAIGDDLTTLGRNYGVNRPLLLGLIDNAFRAYIAELAFKPKLIRQRIEGVLTVIFGPKETAGWEVFEIRRKVITIEIADDALPSGPGFAFFFREDASDVSTDDWTGDYFTATALDPPYLRVKASNISPLSDVPNNSLYLSSRFANRPVLLDVLKQIRAAGIQVEFKLKRD